MSPKPFKIASLKNIESAWEHSRDATSKGGSPGIDGLSPARFAERLETNISDLRNKLLQGNYKFRPLKPHFIEKSPGKFRVICVPTVEDRLAQRVILRHLTYDKDKLNVITPDVSYGIRKGTDQGVRGAIEKAIKFRNAHPWILKTDISKFFDNIPRDYLLKKLQHRLGDSSLMPLLKAVVSSEISIKNKEHEKRITDSGVLAGRGLRQGMPLSPLLSNLVLCELDRKIKRKKFRIIRYADDLIGFGDSKAECETMMTFVKAELEKIELEIPGLTEGSKTEILDPSQYVIFLGVEIYKLPGGKYDRKIPKKTWDRAIEKVQNHSDLAWNINEKYNYAAVVQRLNSIPGGYRSAFKDCTNLDSLENLLRIEAEATRHLLLKNIFGEEVLNKMTDEQKKFMGLA